MPGAYRIVPLPGTAPIHAAQNGDLVFLLVNLLIKAPALPPLWLITWAVT